MSFKGGGNMAYADTLDCAIDDFLCSEIYDEINEQIVVIARKAFIAGWEKRNQYESGKLTSSD